MSSYLKSLFFSLEGKINEKKEKSIQEKSVYRLDIYIVKKVMKLIGLFRYKYLIDDDNIDLQEKLKIDKRVVYEI